MDLPKNHLPSTPGSWEEGIEHAFHHAIHYLPTQGPIAVFVHHNTLHAFEGEEFSKAVISGWKTFGCQPYFSEQRYRDEMASGRIDPKDLEEALKSDLGMRGSEQIVDALTRHSLRLSMLLYPFRSGPENELRWLIAETDALRFFRDDVPIATQNQLIDETRRWVMRDLRNGHDDALRFKQILKSLFEQHGESRIEKWSQETWRAFTLEFLWRICHNGAHTVPHATMTNQSTCRPRDGLLRQTQQDPDLLANDLLIRFSSAFVDQGFASWGLPNRDKGFFECFIELVGSKSFLAESWLREIGKILKEEGHDLSTPLESIQLSLKAAGLHLPDLDEWIEETLLALPGWGGMIYQMETNASWTLKPAPIGSLEGFLAARLLLDRLASMYIASEYTGFRGSYAELVARYKHPSQSIKVPAIDQRAFHLFQFAQLSGWSPQMLCGWTSRDWSSLVLEMEAFSQIERRRLFQESYEHHYRVRALDALSIHCKQAPIKPATPKFQLITCIDDREESFRRHLEEIEPRVETFGAAGFFSVPMYFRGIADAHYIPLCPIVIKPQHYIEEQAVYSMQELDKRRAETRRRIGRASHQVHLGSRGLIAGTITAIFGSLASIPMVARVLFPRLTAQIRHWAGRLVQPALVTQLCIERIEETPSPENGGRGYSVSEMVSIVHRLMGDLGLTTFSPLIFVLGHGSSSLNNPHESAYNCGACGGGRGGPNARALAEMANDPRVREGLNALGMKIPTTTWFVGGYHNTCNDQVNFYDLDHLPPAHRSQFEAALVSIDEARRRNAHERSRRFESAPLSLTPAEALYHVEARAEDLAQARPEYNHATNAMCIVGRRGRTRQMFLDRRSFLTSYDPTTDDDSATILNRILGAVIPVCAGINLEYYFSCVDPVGYGCGSKLPHNITSLLGVMEGAASDLRTGLSQQMVEIHEPVRILFVIETSPEKMLSIMARNPVIDQFVRNAWVQIATLDPSSSDIQLFVKDGFYPYSFQGNTLPEVPCSIDWYRGWRDHLGFSRLEAGAPEKVLSPSKPSEFVHQETVA